MPTAPHQRHQRREPCIEGVTTVLVDPDGDLILRIGGALESEPTADFLVCSSTLRRCSPVFKAMFFGGAWAESWKPSPSSGLPWIVSLPHDSPRDMQTLLHITHASFDSVPPSPSTEELYRILVLANKYDLSRKLSPWVSRWLKVMRDRSAEEIKTEERVWLIRIAWHLGDEKLYLMQLKDFILRACIVPAPGVLGDQTEETEAGVTETADTVEETGNPVAQDEGNNEEVPVEEWLLRTADDNCELGLLLMAPGELECGMPDLPEFIGDCRRDTMISFYQRFCQQTFDRIAPGKWKGHCREPPSSDPGGSQSGLKCDAILLASIFEKWSEGNVEELSPARIDETMLGKSLNSVMKWQIHYSAVFKYMPGHERCTPKHAFEEFEKSFRHDMGCWDPVLRRKERSHLEERRRLFGITDDPEVLVPVYSSLAKEEDEADGSKEVEEWEDV
ncbi:hypothetical protein B0T21DRAFT_336573 [Apiosordaria backusii]|uniref:BTB domain-containing protein n=1 Tax=Apiosordaria backusii TaxID=314023 RepID=A0AA40E6X5_9PEZI|nr:hypothetical protein B0T21DRAFT_336573 [Apiosordaria backusii]